MPALPGHQPLDTLTVGPDPVAAQLPVDPVSAVGAPGRLPDLVYVGQQPEVDQVPVTRPAGLTHSCRPVVS